MTQSQDDVCDRRRFVGLAVSTAALTLAGCASAGHAGAAHSASNSHAHDEAEVTPAEDLMQEHGVIERVLLIYEEGARRIERGEALDPSAIAGAATIVRRFVEDYHEKLEEQFVFPRLEAAGRERELVAVLLRHHQRGREVTDEIQRRLAAPLDAQLAQLLRAFSRMYRPHAAREDTVIFPAFREIVGGANYRELGEQFEDKEHQLFGERGFESTVAQIAQIEVSLGIADLAQFTVA